MKGSLEKISCCKWIIVGKTIRIDGFLLFCPFLPARSGSKKLRFITCDLVILMTLLTENVLNPLEEQQENFILFGHQMSFGILLLEKVFIELSTFSNFPFLIFPRSQVFLLDPIVILDWKTWFSPFLRNMEQHTYHRAFLFSSNQQHEPIIFYKKHLLVNNWKSHQNNPSAGLHLVISIPPGFPSIIEPQFLDEEATRDLLSLSTMSTHHKQFWQNWIEAQFDETDFQIPNHWDDENDFWGTSLISSSSSSISSEELDTDPEDHDIIIRNHPSQIPVHELRVGTIIAVQPDESYYNDNDDEEPQSFWLCLIKGVQVRHSEHYFSVEWLEDENLNTDSNPHYTLNGLLDRIHYNSILHWNITLMQSRNLYTADIRKIERALAERNN